MKKTKKHIVSGLLLLLVVLTVGCVRIGEFYVGLNLQPNMEENEPIQGLNIFGLIKTGVHFDTTNHHFEVQRMMDVLAFDEEIQVDSAMVAVKRMKADGSEVDYRLTVDSKGKYYNHSIEALPGENWLYSCEYDTFKVTATCIIPNLPKLESARVENEGNELIVEVENDSTAFLYMVYVFQGNKAFYDLYLPENKESTTRMILLPEWTIDPKKQIDLYVCAYDANFRAYYTTSNTFFKPNAYRPPYSTVEGGYGVFGAVSICFETLNEFR